MCGNVDNPAISSDLKIAALSHEEIPFLMTSKSQLPRSWLRFKYSLVPNAGHSWAQFSFSGRALHTLGTKIANVAHIEHKRTSFCSIKIWHIPWVWINLWKRRKTHFLFVLFYHLSPLKMPLKGKLKVCSKDEEIYP